MSRVAVDLLEYVTSPAGKPLRVDREKGIIYGVKLLGEESANPPPNNNVYPRSTRERVAPLMEGARVNIDHAPPGQEGRTRSYRDSFGVARAIREGGDGLYGDYHFPPKHPLAEQLFWDAENAPERLGFSIASRGAGTVRDGRHIIEEIAFDPRQHSIDLVSRPATTGGLFEHLRPPPMKRKVRTLIESLAKTRPGFARALREQAEAGILSPDQEMEEPGMKGPDDAPSEMADHEVALKQGFQGAMVAVLNDDSLDMKAKLSKLKEIMTSQEKLLSSGSNGGGGAMGARGPADNPDNNDTDTPTEESLRRQRLAAGQVNLVESLQLQLRVRDLCADAGVRPTKVLRKALDACRSEAEAKELIEEARTTGAGNAGGTTPIAESPLLKKGGARSAAPTKELLGIQESQQGGGQQQPLQFKDNAERLAYMRNGRR
jgi:hypothetical protein